MTQGNHLTNAEIVHRFGKYMKLAYMPLGMYFAETEPQGKVRTQGMLLGRCIVGHIFKAAKHGGISILKADAGCPGGQFWAGFRKSIIRGWASFITRGKADVLGGRAERFKKDVNVAVKMLRDPGPVKRPNGTNFIIFQPLKDIPDTQGIEFVLFFVKPKQLAELITLAHYARHAPYMVTAPSGSGCMSILNYPLRLKQEPEPDAVMGVWDLFARKTIPSDILTLAMRRWLFEEMVLNSPESFLAHTPPFTIWGEIKHFFKTLKNDKKKC